MFEFLKPTIGQIKAFLPKILNERFLSENQKLLVDRILNQSSYVIKRNGKEVGFVNIGLRHPPIDLADDYFYLRLIYILPEHRGKGLGKDLLRSILEKYKKIWAIVDKKNEAARSLFESLGFAKKEFGKQLIFYN
jgi:ribosomal protein S18 acetylase RimI-like enzyme